MPTTRRHRCRPPRSCSPGPTSGTRIALADQTDGETTPADKVILGVLRQQPGPVPITALRTALVAAGVVANDNAAKTLINFAPYLRPAGRGTVTTAGDTGRRATGSLPCPSWPGS